MHKNVVYVADYFINEVVGGAELHGEEIIKGLRSLFYEVSLCKSQDITPELIIQKKDHFWLISNFMMLSEVSKNFFIQNKILYAIIENDHKYCKSNNPMLYLNLLIPEDQIQNKDFYKNAKAVFCQSRLHCETVQKNLILKNIVNLGCNLWSNETVSLLRQHIGRPKTRKFGIMQTNNKNKGMLEAIKYCNQNSINADLIPFTSQEEFIKELSKTETLVFFPTWMETFCRVAVEARILGCKLLTNKCLGCSSEPFFKLKGEDLLNSIESKKNEVLEKISKIIDNDQVNFEQSLLLPNISVITTLYNASEYIEGYLNSFKEQAYINKELIIVDANSTDNSHELFQKFYSQNNDLNIKYIKCDVKINQMKALNIALENSVGEYIAICLIDDRPANDWLEVLSKHLFFNNDIDLVYGDTLQTNKPNETFTNNSSHGRLYEHSRKEFSKENMIKCLPGPMPMFRVSMVKKHGAHREDLPHAGDWELWNRCVRGGSIFKKISSPVGLYFSNPKGMSTDPEKSLIKLKEEKQVFYEYRDVFGKHNFNTFRLYFDQV